MRRILSNIIFQHVTVKFIARLYESWWCERITTIITTVPAIKTPGKRQRIKEKKRSINAWMHHLRGFIRRLDNKRKPLVYIIQSDAYFFFLYLFHFSSISFSYDRCCYSSHGWKSHKLWCKRRRRKRKRNESIENCVTQSIL